jgi:hypothetical protein
VILVGILAAFVFTYGPTKQLINDRVATPHSNKGRSVLYNESVDLAMHKPLLGYGGPQDSTVNPNLPPVGTQGQLWTVLVSNGMPATFFFFGYFIYAMGRTRRARSELGFWCHTVILVAVFQSPFYGLLASQLHIVFVAIALAARDAVEPEPAPGASGQATELASAPVPVAAGATANGHSLGLQDGNGAAARRPGPWGPWLYDRS